MSLVQSNACRPLDDLSKGNACASCQRRRLCENLARTMDSLQTEATPVTHLRLWKIRDFLRTRLEELGFRFPSSPQLCLFSQLDANHARQILFQVRDLYLEWIEISNQIKHEQSSLDREL